MYTFNTPPGWPEPPHPGWQPPLGWQPDQSWPAPPPGWSFWLNSRGTRGLGPRGAYGALGRGRLVAGAGAVGAALFLGVGLAASDDNPAQFAATPGPATTVTATVTATAPAPAAGRVTVTAPPRTLPRTTVRVTVTAPRVTVTATRPAPVVGPTDEPTQENEPYYSSCAAARRAGDTPLYRGDPGYGPHLDGDDDGVACEN